MPVGVIHVLPGPMALSRLFLTVLISKYKREESSSNILIFIAVW